MNYKKIKYPWKSKTYKIEAIELAYGYCPRIYPCGKCGHPVITGYCCTICGTAKPEKVEVKELKE